MLIKVELCKEGSARVVVWKEAAVTNRWKCMGNTLGVMCMKYVLLPYSMKHVLVSCNMCAYLPSNMSCNMSCTWNMYD